MINAIYVEKSIIKHPRTSAIIARFPKSTIIECNHYNEVFNPNAQNFRIQKQQPALILASKHKNRVLPAPQGYGIGSEQNYYFSHLLNCCYDCRYCFLQGMYRSANYVLFVNYEDFMADIESICRENSAGPIHFFSGYDSDSLALEPVTHFVESFLPFFAKLPNALMECRTKSSQTSPFKKQQVLKNTVIAYSFTPNRIAKALEHKVPTLEKRIKSMVKLANQGWPIGLRFDPLIYHDAYQEDYRELFNVVFSALKQEQIHSVSLGSFRMPTGFFQNIKRLYPTDWLFAGSFEKHQKMTSYPQSLNDEMFDFCQSIILHAIPQEKFFPCPI